MVMIAVLGMGVYMGLKMHRLIKPPTLEDLEREFVPPVIRGPSFR